MHRQPGYATALLAALFSFCSSCLSSACTSDTSDPDSLEDDVLPAALVGVQETNVRPSTSPPACEQNEYSRKVSRTCDGKEVAIVVCASEPLCEAQIDALAAEIVACRETRDSFEWTPEERCA